MRDCAEFVLRVAEQQLVGVFNLVKPGIALADCVERLACTQDASVAEGMTIEQEMLLRQQVR